MKKKGTGGREEETKDGWTMDEYERERERKRKKGREGRGRGRERGGERVGRGAVAELRVKINCKRNSGLLYFIKSKKINY